MTDKRWSMLSYDEEKALALAQALGIRPLYGRLLATRNISTYDAARGFFRPSLGALHDPFLMKDMDKAVHRINKAIQNREKILIYGDYDVDGTTAIAVTFSFLSERYNLIDFYVPHRYHEGYGISIKGINYAREHDFSLIIALDCGIKAVEKIAYAHSLGLDVIVCDHHLPDHKIPGAEAILNPKQPGCNYPYKELCGCGIGFKLITALAKHWHLQEGSVFKYLDLVATGIAADIVPITGENRILTHYGLKKINTDPLPGLKALLQLGGAGGEAGKQLSVEELVFIIAPRVNAAGRMDEAHKAVYLFIEKEYNKALHYAEMLNQDNTHRKDLDKNITAEVLDIITQESLQSRNTTVLYRPHWHKGVIGIVASRVMETYYRPTIILTKSQDKVTGSARSVKDFNIYKALLECDDLLENYGGHFYAAGMTLQARQVQAFADRFEAIVSATIDPELLIPEIKIDAPITFNEINNGLYSMLQQFEPFGPGNMQPVFLASGVRDTGYSSLVKQQHIRFDVRQGNGKIFSGIGFNLSNKFDIVASGKPFDMCFSIDENQWNGKSFLQLKVTDIRAAESYP